MTKEEAQKIYSLVEQLNKKYNPIELKCNIGSGNTEEFWYATIICDLSDDINLDLASLKFNYHAVMDRLAGWNTALEAVKQFKHTNGSLYFVYDKKEEYIKFNSDDSPQSDDWWEQM